MSDNIDIKIREDGSRVVSRNLNDIADSADKADKSVKNVNSTLKQTGNASTGLERLKRALDQTNISLMQAFDSSRVERFGRALVQYRNGLMKHFEEISKGARASSAAIKSQMESLTAKPIGLEAMSAYYREQEEAHNKFLKSASDNIAKQLALEAESSAERLKLAGMRRAEEEKYTSWWAKELSARDVLEQKAIADSVRNLKLQEEAEQKSYTKRIKDASTFAAQAVNAKRAAEEAYTTWWLAELKKRDTAAAAANLKSAQQRSGMQAFSAERLDRSLIKGANPQSALYAADDSGNTNRRTALQTMELQAMQRQMAMMQLLYPMAQAQLAIDKEAEATAHRHIRAKESLVTTNGKLAASTRTAADNQHFWNTQSREAHALARGLSGSLGQLWLTYGSILPLLTGAALGSAFAGAAKSGGEMAYQLAFVKALGGETEQAISRLSDQAHELGTKGAHGPKELASGYRVLSQAGKNAAESLAIMPDVLNLATVGELKMEEAGLALVGTMNAFRLQTEDSTRVSDLFAKAAAVSQSSVQDLTQSMRYASTTSTMYKQNLEDTMTALTLLARVNITGTSAGTSYRNMLKEIYTPTEKAKRSWQDLGIKMTEVVDGKEKVRSFVNIMYDLQKVMSDPKKGFTEKGQLNIIGELFGERGSKEAAEMLTIVKGKWMELRDELGNSKGFGQKVTGALNDTAKNQWAAALNTLESSLAKSFDNMENGFVGFAAKLKGIFASEEFNDTLNQFVKGIVALGNVLLEASPYLLDFAKAWLVLKAAQVGVSLGQIMLTAASGAQMLAVGMLAASGAMGPVARGATMLGPLLAALGGPLTIILSLLTAGAAAWLLWGRNAETASGKAIKATETRLAELKKQEKFGDGELGKAREELEIRENRLSHMVAARQSGNNLEEARQAVDLQQQLVTLLEEREQKMMNIAKVAVPKVDVPKFGTRDWNTPEKDNSGDTISGRLSKDDNSLATLQSKLRALEKEYAIMVMIGDSQFKLNDGAKEAIKIEERITLLKEKNISVTQPKALKQYQEQLTSLYEQLNVARELENQQKEIAKHKFSEELRRQLEFAKMLPREREIENKLLQKRHQLMSEGILLSKEQEDSLRNQLEVMRDIERLSNAQGALQNSMAPSDMDVMEDEINQWKAVWDTINHMPGGAMYHQEIENVKMYIEELMNIWNDAVKPLQQVEFKLKALNDAFAHGGVTADYYNQKLAEFNIQTANLLNTLGYGDDLSFIVGSFEQVMQGFVNLSADTSQILGNTWNTFADGLANSLARSIVYAEDFGTAIRDVARQAVSELIAALIKLGIQYMLNQVIASTSIAASLAQNAAAASATAAMWSPAAAAASLATLGSNSTSAIAGMTAAKAASTSLFAFATGGSFTVGGSGGVDSQIVSMRASPGERVTISTPMQVRKGTAAQGQGGQGALQPTVVTPKIINVLDPAIVGDYLGTDEGEQLIMNVVQRNQRALGY